MFTPQSRPIKLYYEGDTDLFYNQQTRLILKLSKWLGTHNRILFVPLNEAELIWTTIGRLNQQLLNTNLPIILDDRHQGPELFQNIRELLPNKQIRKILKQTKLKDTSAYNDDLINYSHHQHIIAKAFNQSEQQHGAYHPPISTDTAQKITVSWNYIGWGDFVTETRYDAHDHPKLSNHYRIDIDHEKDIDVNFLANTSFTSPSAPLLDLHRQAAYTQTMNLQGVQKVVQQCNQHRRDWPDYFNILCRSKITISPWGWEPVTIRDIEAALAGSIIIKPDTNWLETWPTIQYKVCKEDYSDLPELVKEILSNWEYYDTLRQTNMETIAQAAETIGYRIVEIIRT